MVVPIHCSGGALQSANEDKSLYGTFTLSPWDKELDWSLLAKAAPCYVTVCSALLIH